MLAAHSEFYQIPIPEKSPDSPFSAPENALTGTHVNIKFPSLPEVFVAGNLTRKELLKEDKFKVEAGNTFDWVSTHRKEVIRYGGIALAVIVVAAGFFYYQGSQASVREQILGEDIALSNAPVGQAAQPGGPSFPTQAAKSDAVKKAFTKLATDYSGSEEAYIADYYLGTEALNAGTVDEARKRYQEAADHANANYASVAKLALAQLDFAENRTAEAESILKGLMDNPTDLVSKAQATFTYARVIAPTKPDEARKLLMQLAGRQDEVGQLALAAANDLPQQQK